MERSDPPSAMTVFRGSVPAASSAFLEKKTKTELECQLDQLQGECVAKEGEIAKLKELMSQGKTQKAWQKALEENRDLRREVERLYEEQISVKEISALLKAQEALTESVQKDFADYREQTRIGIEKMRQDREEADNQLIVFRKRVDSIKQVENETVDLTDELQKKVHSYEAELQSQAVLIAKLKDGTRLDELETATVSLSNQLSRKEIDRQDLERALLQARSENEQLLLRTEDFEAKFNETLSDVVTDLTQELHRYKNLAEMRGKELTSERARYLLLEDHALLADRKLLEMGQRIRLYESGYCLDDALKEQRSLNEQLAQLQQEITTMAANLSTRENQLERLLEENRVLRVKAGVDIEWRITEAELELRRNVEVEKLSSLNDHFKMRIEKLEKERIELLEELRQSAVQKGENGVVFFGLSAGQMDLVEKYAECLRNDEHISPASEASTKLQIELDRALAELTEMKTRYNQAVSQCDELKRSIPVADSDKKIDRIMELISGLHLEKHAENSPKHIPDSDPKYDLHIVGDHRVPAAHLVACLQELAKTEELLQSSRTTIASYETSISTLSDRVNALFLLHSETTDNFTIEKDQLEEVIEKMSSQLSTLVQPMENDTPASEEAAADVSRRHIAVLKSNEILLTRRLNLLEQTLSTLESRETRGRNDRIKLERVLKTRIVQLEYSLSNATSRTQTLEAQLRESVHRALYEVLQIELQAVQSKLSELLVDHANLQQQCQKISVLQSSVNRYATEAGDANAQVDSLTNQINVLQGKLDDMSCEDDKKVVLLAQVAALEIREGNAQRALLRAQNQIAESASRYSTVLADLHSLEDKYQSLQMLYQTEKEANAQLRKVLSAQKSDHSAATANLQSLLFIAKNNAVRFRKLFQIAKKQAVQLNGFKLEIEEQLAGLNRAVIELQSSSDEHAALGHLHHELIDARLEIRTLKRDLEGNVDQMQTLETDILRLSKLLDENATAAFAENVALRSRIECLQQCVVDVNAASNWGLTKDQAWTLHQANKSLANKLNDARSEIIQADCRRRQAEEALDQLNVDLAQNSESRCVVNALQSGGMDEQFQMQIVEWTKQLKQLKFAKLQLQKLLAECQDDVERLQTMVSEKDSKLIAQTVHFKQHASALAQLSTMKPLGESSLSAARADSSESGEHWQNEIRKVRQDAKNLQAVLESKEEIIDLQRHQLNKLESKLQADAEMTVTASSSHSELSKEVLKVAETTIQNLRVLLTQKDVALNKYREILDRSFQKYHSAKELDILAIEQLKDQIIDEKSKQSSTLQTALSKIDVANKIPMALVSVQQHDEMIALKQKTIDELSLELRTVQSLLEQSRQRADELAAENNVLKGRIQVYEDRESGWQESEQMLADFRQELVDKSRKQAHLEDVIFQLKEQMVVFRQQQLPPPPVQPAACPADAAFKKTIASLKSAIKKLENQKAEQEKKFKILEEQHLSALNDLQLARKALESSHDEISSLHHQLNNARSKVKTQRDKQAALSEKLTSLNMDLEQLQQAKSEVDSLRGTVSGQERLIVKLKRCAEPQQHAANEAATTSRACSPVHFPEIETVSPRLPPKESFEQWEMKKKLEKKVDTLKKRMQDKSNETTQLETCISDLKTKLKRLESDNRQLIEEVRQLEHGGHRGKGNIAALSDSQLQSLEELRSQLFTSQDEALSLKRQLQVEAAARIAQLEFELKSIQALVKDKPRSAPEKSKLKQELDELSQKHLATSCENLDLRFDKEHSNIITQRLRKRIAQLEQLIARGMKSCSKDSKSESELTATIDSMAKIIDLLKQENETLRLNSHSHLKYTEAVRSLKRAKKEWSVEVDALKGQLHAKMEKIASLVRAESASKFNCRSLRKDLAKVKKELDAKESEAGLLTQSVQELEWQIEQLRQTNARLQDASQHELTEAAAGFNPDTAEPWIDLQSKYADLVTENQALKTELSAFDESFFDEIEDLKFQFAETSKRLAEYRVRFGELAVH